MLEQLKEHLAFEPNAVTLLNQDRLFLLQPIIESLLGDHAKYKNNWLVKRIDNMLAKDRTDPWNDGNKTRSARSSRRWRRARSGATHAGVDSATFR